TSSPAGSTSSKVASAVLPHPSTQGSRSSTPERCCGASTNSSTEIPMLNEHPDQAAYAVQLLNNELPGFTGRINVAQHAIQVSGPIHFGAGTTLETLLYPVGGDDRQTEEFVRRMVEQTRERGI